jgi:transposase, IS30 family
MDFEIRKDRNKAHGPRRLHQERAAYLDLVNQGYSSVEACRIVGINPRTGKRWRNGRQASGRFKAASPITAVAPPSGPSRYLTEDDRIHIADRLREGAGVRMIARELGRAPSTISREIRRNQHPGYGGYRPHAAQRRADARRPRPKQGKIATNPQLREVIQSLLVRRWSPEQICETLRRRFPGDQEMHVAHETIYQALYMQAKGGLRWEVARALRTGRAMRTPRRQAQRRVARYTTPMVMIQRTAGRSRRPGRSRALGGRFDHRARRSLGHRHPGRTLQPVPDAGPAASRPRSHPGQRCPPGDGAHPARPAASVSCVGR